MVGARSGRQALDKSTGEALRAARRQKKLTLNEAASALRIPPKHLESLEEGDLAAFAAEVYARGAYVKYAKYLGVEKQKVYYSFLRSLSVARETVPLKLPLPATWLARMFSAKGIVVLGIGLGGVVVVGYLFWQIRSFVGLPALELTEPAAGVLEQSMVMVRGRTAEDVHVRVNGETTLLGENGLFEAELPLRPGINVVQVEATGASGRIRTIQRELLVSL